MENGNNTFYVSVIIPALNEEKYISICLDSLLEVEVGHGKLEVIVVDNGSTDKTCSIVKKYIGKLSLRLYVEKDVTISALRNFGVKKAKGDIFAFLDADCSVASDWLIKALPYFTKERVGAAGSSHVMPGDMPWVPKTWDIIVGKKRKKGLTNSLRSGNMWVSKVNFYKVDGFNEELKTNEDYDLCFRLRKEGFIIYTDPDIKAYHWDVPMNIVDFYSKNRWHGTDVWKVFCKNISQFRNGKVVLYAVYYFIAILGIPFFLLFFFSWVGCGMYLVFLFVPAMFFSAVSTIKRKQYKDFPRLTVLYFIYGVARAHSLMDNIISFFGRR